MMMRGVPSMVTKVPNGTEWITSFGRKHQLGTITTPVTTPAARQEFEKWMKDLRPAALVSAKTAAPPVARATARVATRRIGGCAVPYGVEGRLYDSYLIRFEIGAFDAFLRSGREVRLLMDHDERQLLGSTTDGELRLKTDYFGLHFEADIDKDLARLLVEREFRVSIGDITIDKSVSMIGGKNVESRTKCDLREISFTKTPRFGGTKVKFL
jgi:HK97 family phage prohead protease